jgi:uncharacterized protein (TIGR02145 family)
LNTNGITEKIEKGTTVNISVDAKDDDGAVTDVRIYIDNAMVASSKTAPYEYKWETEGEELGVHVIKATATDDSNASTSDQKQLIIQNKKPTAEFSCSQMDVKIGQSVSFVDESTENPNSWSWDFGDGDTSTEQNPTHIYQNEGKYTIALTATNETGSDTEIKSEYITVEPENSSETGTVADIDGNVYKTVQIGEQWWMAENLAVTHYSDGSPIPDGTGHGSINEESEPAYWFAWGDDLDNVSAYGRLYTYFVVVSDKNVCPDGWHVSTDNEWQLLIDHVYNNGYAGQEGKALKADYGWISGAGVDAFEFEGLPGGCRYSLGQCLQKGYKGYFWTDTGFDDLTAWSYILRYDSPTVKRNNDVKKSAFSVRCVRNENN